MRTFCVGLLFLAAATTARGQSCASGQQPWLSTVDTNKGGDIQVCASSSARPGAWLSRSLVSPMFSGGGTAAQHQDGIALAGQLSGSDWCAKVNAAETALPAGGGIIDTRGLTGAQACKSGTVNITKPTKIIAGQMSLTYSVAPLISASASLTFVGAGRGVTVITATAIDQPAIYGTDFTGLTVSGVTFVGPSSMNNDGKGTQAIDAFGVQQARVFDNEFTRWSQSGIGISYSRSQQNSTYWEVDDNSFHDMAGEGIVEEGKYCTNGTNSADSDYENIHDNWFWNLGVSAWDVCSMHNKFHHNHLVDVADFTKAFTGANCGDASVIQIHGDYNEVTDNDIEGTGGSWGISTNGNSSLLVKHNIINRLQGAGCSGIGWGITINSTSRTESDTAGITIEDNRVTNNTAGGIQLVDSYPATFASTPTNGGSGGVAQVGDVLMISGQFSTTPSAGGSGAVGSDVLQLGCGMTTIATSVSGGAVTAVHAAPTGYGFNCVIGPNQPAMDLTHRGATGIQLNVTAVSSQVETTVTSVSRGNITGVATTATAAGIGCVTGSGQPAVDLTHTGETGITLNITACGPTIRETTIVGNDIEGDGSGQVNGSGIYLPSGQSYGSLIEANKIIGNVDSNGHLRPIWPGLGGTDISLGNQFVPETSGIWFLYNSSANGPGTGKQLNGIGISGTNGIEKGGTGLYLNLGATGTYGWVSVPSSNYTGRYPLSLQPDGGNVGIGTTSPQTLFDVAGPVRAEPTAYRGLPTCSSAVEGAMRAVTDSNTTAWGAAIAGEGSHHVLAYCDGTAWTVAAK